MIKFKPQHEGLRVIARGTFTFDEPPYKLITFLNRALKKKGFIFGVTRNDDTEYTITVYDASDVNSRKGEEGAALGKRGEGIGTDHYHTGD